MGEFERIRQAIRVNALRGVQPGAALQWSCAIGGSAALSTPWSEAAHTVCEQPSWCATVCEGSQLTG